MILFASRGCDRPVGDRKGGEDEYESDDEDTREGVGEVKRGEQLGERARYSEF